eukprot:TRINITY_DN24541_c0_g1_i1.p1 TRINITY_DN24541_c0_g1~~TRINITY_DN24541_c0_g1_i1.p1  ORF type:complete len:174 (+),score=31.19 TRINITY_DN24541_c0_g1_i1:333-854(+)
MTVPSYGTSIPPAPHFHSAVRRGEAATVEQLLKGGKIDVNEKNEHYPSALHFAAGGGSVEVVRILLEAKADVKAVAPTSNETALHSAAQQGHDAVAKMLLEHGAEPNACAESGDTALHNACAKGHLEMAKLLVQGGADVNQKNLQDYTPLACAEDWATPQLVDFLKEAGATRF